MFTYKSTNKIVKNTAIISMIVMMCCNFSCKQNSTSEQLIGKWKFARLDMGKLKSQVEGERIAMLVEMLNESLVESTSQYFKDMTYEKELPQYHIKEIGAYKLMNDGKYLICTHKGLREGEVIEEQFEIVKVTKDSLLIKAKEEMLICYSRVNE
jgi:hypothetical protein